MGRLLSILLISFFALPFPVRAAEIEPLRLELAAAAGSSAPAKLTVTNHKPSPVKIQVHTGPYRYAFSAHTILPSNPVDQQLPSCESWVRVTQEELPLGSGESAVIELAIDVPESAAAAQAGEYVAAVLVDELPDSAAAGRSAEGQGVVQILPRVAIPLYLFIKGQETPQGQLVQFTAETGPSSGISKFTLTLGNEGKVHVRPSGTILVLNEQKQILHRSGLGKTIPIFPKFQEAIPVWVPLKAGRYAAVATVDFGGDNLFQREILFQVTADGQTQAR